jgi:hypothetical protein
LAEKNDSGKTKAQHRQVNEIPFSARLPAGRKESEVTQAKASWSVRISWVKAITERRMDIMNFFTSLDGANTEKMDESRGNKQFTIRCQMMGGTSNQITEQNGGGNQGLPSYIRSM